MHTSITSMLLRLALTAGTLLVLWALGEPVTQPGNPALTRLQVCPDPARPTGEVAEVLAVKTSVDAGRARKRRLTLTLPFAVNLSPVNAGDAERI
ncbi:MAG: hypothetical protein BWZ07_01395 [Alphaproteobacteria bacterium ADurb.BinA280]|jgi:hypothetical protein|nr:hypothetical protein [Aquimonas sp.]OPZ12310.1 MAG: hypothetical protein BWZ07_01395 [Alphaproteobacteria bacterium ADurb.BinA280]